MADIKKNKRKSRENPNHKAEKPNKKPKPKTLSNGDHKNKKRKGGDDKKKKMTGPRLPSFLRKELDRLNPRDEFNSDVEDIDSEEGNDLYEYEEGLPEEESMKNHRYDRVDNYEYELPDQFKDENVQSDDEDNEYGGGGNSDNDDVDDGRHLRMLQGITGMPTEAFEGKKKRKNVVITEAYPESEYNPSRDVLDGKGHVTIEDLVESLQGKSGYSQLRKRTQQMEKKSVTLQAPLPREDRDKLNRRATYEVSKKDITKWEPLIKRNREAPTIIFDRDIDLGFSTVGAIASEFEPRTEFEKKMAALVHDDKVMEAHKEDGAKLLELNEISLEDYKRQRNHIAKMRSLLFHHEVKMKRIKKIKSKTYRRLSKKDRSKLGSADLLMDPEAAKEQAMKQEFKRAEERMTLRHKNRSKWAKHILERGLNAQDEGTRAAMAEQLNEHTRLTRKMKSMRDTSSSDDSSHEDNDDGDSSDSDQDEASKVLKKAKQRTLKILEEDNEVPLSGVLSLPFMVRGLKKKGEAASEEAKLALQEYESSLKQLEDTDEAKNKKMGVVSGRRVFGGPIKQVAEQKKTIKRDGDYSDSDHEIEIEAEEENEGSLFKTNGLQRDVIPKDSKTHQDLVSQGFDDIVSGPRPKTTYEVAIFASDTWKKMPSQKVGKNIKGPSNGVQIFTQNEVLEEVEEGSNSEGEMVDGILSSSPKGIYKLPSQEDLIREAFAGDDVEEEFAKDKDEILNEENPEAEKPVLLPGWGQWTHVQKKKGLPSWMVEEHEIAKRKRDEALKTRKDAHLKHVIISEKLDKKAEKLHTKTLPYPFTSKEVYEQSIRMPIGPEFNPATAVGALNRPEVLKRPGVIIKPVKFEEVDPYEKSDEHRRKGQKQKPRRNGSRSKLKAVVAKS